ncbi:MAG: aminotransferase class V-fold PLP-dependent enzyme [Phycisphaeraceae bacterium]|nr:MAG: aminotransferase class V-fold PLP-dependent enzyme [Phycisphaeraceae bacterium]
MTDSRRIYLDNAATSFPKPAAVHEAMSLYATTLGASPGRGSYHESVEGGRLIAQCRRRLCRLFNAPSPDHVAFTLNASDALNLAIKGIAHHERARRAREGSNTRVHFVATSMDHNSVLRPLNALAADPVGAPVEWTCLAADPGTGLVDPADLRAAIRPETALVIAVHASNVSGTIQPINDFGAVCRDAGVPFLVDAAQSAGRLPIDFGAIDLLAIPGHKYLMGPLGTGALIIRPGVEVRIDPVREGGTGTVSESDLHPDSLPDRYEPGSHNTLGLVGLSAGVQWILDRDVETLWRREQALVERFTDALANRGEFPGLRLLGPHTAAHRAGVFSLVHEAIGPHELAAILESEFGVLARAGVHCAPRAHETFGTRDAGGATRLSLGPFVTDEDASATLDALREICAHTAAAS